MSQTTEKKLENALYLLNLARRKDISEAIENWGYTEKRLSEGDDLYKKALKLVEVKNEKYQEQYNFTKQLHHQAAVVRNDFGNIVILARRVFIDDKTYLEDLGINGPLAKSFNQWISQAEGFYSTLSSNREMLAKFSEFNVEDLLKGKREALDALRVQKIEHYEIIGEAQVATIAKNKVLKKLYRWCGHLLTVCRIACKENPDQLETINQCRL